MHLTIEQRIEELKQESWTKGLLALLWRLMTEQYTKDGMAPYTAKRQAFQHVANVMMVRHMDMAQIDFNLKP